MIITRTPLRISFFGGGTDYPDYFRRYGGQTLGVSIDKYSYINVSKLEPLFDHRIHISYRKTELVRDIDEIQHPSVRECLRRLGLKGDLDISYKGELPARTGLGSSSSFTVGLLHALLAYQGRIAPKHQLATDAVYVEQTMIGERVGVQDQHLCAIGGMLLLRIDQSGTVSPTPVPMEAARRRDLASHLMLMYTGIQRHAHEVLEHQLDRTRDGTNLEHLRALHGSVDEGLQILLGEGSLGSFGELLDAAWKSKRALSRFVSNSDIDRWYAIAKQNGAIGGKLLGAGGGGFLLLFTPPDRQADVKRALPELKHVPFQFEDRGTQLIFHQPDGY